MAAVSPGLMGSWAAHLERHRSARVGGAKNRSQPAQSIQTPGRAQAWLLADMAHISGLVAAGLVPSPFDYAGGWRGGKGGPKALLGFQPCWGWNGWGFTEAGRVFEGGKRCKTSSVRAIENPPSKPPP